MSLVAEYAARLQERIARGAPRICTPRPMAGTVEKLFDIRAVIFDVYGTLIDYRKDGFEDPRSREQELLEAFDRVIEAFGFRRFLQEMAPGAPAAKTLSDLYHGLIALDHQRLRSEEVQTPELRIERIWGVILMMLKRRGYDPAALCAGDPDEVAHCVAYHYNFFALGRGLYAGVVPALAQLKRMAIRCGVLSNAQFYTPIDLTLFIREQSGGSYDDHHELIDPDLEFYSFEYGVAKPGLTMFEKLYNALYELHILPAQTVFVGNDLAADILPASDLGMKTAFFAGDARTAYVHDLEERVVADIVFTAWDELPARIAFHEEKK